MVQLLNHWIKPQDMVRSRAWREGYESFRLRQPPSYTGRRDKALAYEYGRLTAAFLRGEGVALQRVQTRRPMHDHQVPPLSDALMQCLDNLATREAARKGG